MDRSNCTLLTRDQILAKVDELPRTPIAIEAFWDGDTTGWFLVLAAVLDGTKSCSPPYDEFQLAALRGEGGDMRIFNGQVPPWPESQLAQDVGQELAERFGIPFYFPSPEQPDDDCPRWWEQDAGKSCKNCGKRVKRQKSQWVNDELCSYCQLDEEKRLRK